MNDSVDFVHLYWFLLGAQFASLSLASIGLVQAARSIQQRRMAKIKALEDARRRREEAERMERLLAKCVDALEIAQEWRKMWRRFQASSKQKARDRPGGRPKPPHESRSVSK